MDHLKEKGVNINEVEYESAQIAILLHDIGHGPFSHALEYSLIKGITHEKHFITIHENAQQRIFREIGHRHCNV